MILVTALIVIIASVQAFRPSSTIRYQKTSFQRLQVSLFAEHSEALVYTMGSMDTLVSSTQSMLHSLQHGVSNSLLLSDENINAASAASLYSKVDKTGFIGFFANYIEIAIDFGHRSLQATGLKDTYGASIILFTLMIKALTFPLTKTQIVSTTRMQSLTPLQEKIKARYPDKADEQTKNQMLSQLFQAANVNPLAGCLPALAQIPIFISLYRALQNLVAENKLDEPFLWIPDLEGPIYTNAPDYGWIKSAFTGNPSLGWHDTLAFLSLPFILFISQTISQKALQPPKDPKKILTDQEQFSQGLVNNLPFIVAFFSINVPAGLALYWIINNAMTTIITLATKASIKQEPLSTEVVKMMAMIEAGPGKMATRSTKSSGKNELRTGIIEKKSIAAASNSEIGFSAQRGETMPSNAASVEVNNASRMDTAETSSSVVVSVGAEEKGEDGDDDSEPEKKRKKRTKPAQSKKGKR